MNNPLNHHHADSSDFHGNHLPVQHERSLWRRIFILLRNRIFAGMVILLPLFFTAYVIIWLGGLLHKGFDKWLTNSIKGLGSSSVHLRWLLNEQVSYFIVILLSIFLIGSALYLVGLFSTAYAVRRVVDTGEKVISKIPVINFIYNLAKQIAAVAVQSDEKKPKKVVFIEYPRKGIRSVAFATGETIVEGSGEHLVNLFLPSTPNPTTGFLLMLPPDQVWETNLTIEQATKFILSFGLMTPNNLMMRPYRIDDKNGDMPKAEIPAPVPADE